MTASRLALTHVRAAALALALAFAGQLVGCALVHEREVDGGPGADAPAVCADGESCSAGQCYCARCLPLDIALPACDPPCATAQAGDLCTTEGRTCPIGICGALVCTSGSFVERGPTPCVERLDAGPPDVGACECPAPPPGCVYDGAPCLCSHMTCAPERCGRDVCAAGTTCCNASCGICVGPGGTCAAVECGPNCTPQDARSGGRCAGSAGWAWDGVACREIACRCVGSECDSVYATEAECEAYFGACPAMVDCTSDDASGEGACAAVIGYAFTPRGCVAISGCSCTGADCDLVAGRSEAACNAAHASCPVLFH